jgi:AhpD family alkylhydroperoxidase
MKTIQVFDPALCCSTGVCGVDVDQALVNFAADVDWAKQNGARIERFNLGQQPLAFAEKSTVKAFLERSGQEGLPLILVDGEVALAGRYPTRDELSSWLAAGSSPSIFTEQVAELVAIGAAIAANCEPCFTFHYDKARKLGVTATDMRRAVDLAQKVKDTPARAMLDLAQRYLEPSNDKTTTVKAEIGTSPQKGVSSCCAPASNSGGSTAGKCC